MTEHPPSAVLESIRTVLRMGEERARRRTFGDRPGDATGGFAGTVGFAVPHLVRSGAWAFGAWAFGTWAAVNAGSCPFAPPTVPVSMGGVPPAISVPVERNRAGPRADRRARLDLQVNLPAEKEPTTVIRRLERISARSNTEREAVDEEAREPGEAAAGDLARGPDETPPEDA